MFPTFTRHNQQSGRGRGNHFKVDKEIKGENHFKGTKMTTEGDKNVVTGISAQIQGLATSTAWPRRLPNFS